MARQALPKEKLYDLQKNSFCSAREKAGWPNKMLVCVRVGLWLKKICVVCVSLRFK